MIEGVAQCEVRSSLFSFTNERDHVLHSVRLYIRYPESLCQDKHVGNRLYYNIAFATAAQCTTLTSKVCVAVLSGGYRTDTC
jgi:hypothetical protein